MGQFAGAISNSAIGGAGVSDTESYRQAKEQLEKDFKQADLNRSPAQNEILYQQLLNQGNSPEEAARILRGRGVTVPTMPNINTADTEEKKVDTGDPNREISVTSFLTPVVGGRLAEAADKLIEKAQKEIEKIAGAVRRWWEFDSTQVRTTPPPREATNYRNRPAIEIHKLQDLEGFGSIDSQASLLGFYDGFVLTSVSVADVEKVDIIETFGAPHIFASGTFVKKVTLSGFVRAYSVSEPTDGASDLELRVPDYVKFRNFYEDYLRVTRMAENGTIARLVVDGETYEGFFTTLSLNRDAGMEQVIPWSASLLVVNHVHQWDSAADAVLRSRIKQVETEELSLTAEEAWAEANDAEGNMNIFVADNPRDAVGEGKKINITTGLLSNDKPHTPPDNAEPLSAIFGKGSGSSGLMVSIKDNIKGIELVGLPLGTTDYTKGKDLRKIIVNGRDGAPTVTITYRVTDYYALIDSILALGTEVEDEKKNVNYTVVFTVQSEISEDQTPVTVSVNLTLSTESSYFIEADLYAGPTNKLVHLIRERTTKEEATFTATLNEDRTNVIYNNEDAVEARFQLKLKDADGEALSLDPTAYAPGSMKFKSFKVAPSVVPNAFTSPKAEAEQLKVDTTLITPPSQATDAPYWQTPSSSAPTTPLAVDASRLQEGILTFDSLVAMGRKKDGEYINWGQNGSPFEFYKYWIWEMEVEIPLRGLLTRTIKIRLAVNAFSAANQLYSQVRYVGPKDVLTPGQVAGGQVGDFSAPENRWFSVGEDPTNGLRRIIVIMQVVIADRTVGIPDSLKAELEKGVFSLKTGLTDANRDRNTARISILEGGGTIYVSDRDSSRYSRFEQRRVDWIGNDQFSVTFYEKRIGAETNYVTTSRIEALMRTIGRVSVNIRSTLINPIPGFQSKGTLR